MQNKAEIKRDVYEDHPAQGMARMQVKAAGVNICPLGFEYQGSAVIHFYKQNGTLTFVFGSQLVNIHNIPEAQVDVGLKELRRALMAVFGREDKRRKDL